MGWLRSSMSFLARGLPTLPTGLPAWILIVPSGAGGLLAALVCGTRAPLQVLVLMAIGASFVFVVNHRAWVVAPLLIVDLSLVDYWVPAFSMSLRLLVTLAATLSSLAILRRSSPLLIDDIAARYVVVPAVVFIVISTVVNLLFSEIGFVVKYLRYRVVLALVMILIIVLVRDRRALAILASIAVIMAVASSLVGIGQRVGGSLALYATATGEPIVFFGSRALGLTSSPVNLANHLVSVVVPTLGFLAIAWSNQMRARIPLLLASLVMLAGVYLSTTRSAILAVAAGVIVILITADERRRFAISGIILTITMLFGASFALGMVDQRFLTGTEEDKSAASHAAIGQVALAVAADNALFGIGRENFEQVSLAYASEVSLGGAGKAQQLGQGIVGSVRPHNDFLEVLSSWGIFALLAYLGIFAGALRNFMVARRSADPLVRGLAIGCAAGLVAYAVGSTFHNYFDSSAALWCYAGLSAALTRVPERATARLGALRRRPAVWLTGRRVVAATARA